MASRQLNTLYFVKFEHKTDFDRIVFCVTVGPDIAEKQAQAAEIKGRLSIADHCRADYKLVTVEAICRTPDAVDGFEPC